MNIYNYDDEGVYTGEGRAGLDPLESTAEKLKYLLPRNAVFEKPDFQEGYVPVFNKITGIWTLIEDHRGQTGFDDDGSVVIKRAGKLADLGLSATARPPRPLSKKQEKNAALQALEFYYADDLIIQIRPQDESHIRNSIEIMEREQIGSIRWRLKNNTTATVSVPDLKAALRTYQSRVLEIWEKYNS